MLIVMWCLRCLTRCRLRDCTGPGGPSAYIPPGHHPPPPTPNDGHGAGLRNIEINESETSNQIVIEVDENNIIPDTMAKTNKAGMANLRVFAPFTSLIYQRVVGKEDEKFSLRSVMS